MAQHIRIHTKGKDAAVRMADKAPPFSEDMKRDSSISFETRKFRQEDIGGFDDAGGGGSTIGNTANNGGREKKAAGKADTKSANANRQDKAGQKQAAAKKKGGGSRVGKALLKAGGKAVGKGGLAAVTAPAKIFVQTNDDLKKERRDNLGLRSIEETKNAFTYTKRTVNAGIKTTRAAANITGKTARATVKVAKKAAQVVKKAAEVAVKVAQKVAAAVGKIVAAIAANPIVLIVILAVLLIILLIFLIVSSLQSTPKNVMGEEMYNELRQYTRDKDRAVLLLFEEYEKQEQFADIAEDDVTKTIEVYPSTSFKLLSAYLLAKYDTQLTVEVAQAEIDAIHELLYTIEHEIETVEYEAQEPVIDERGNPVLNPDGTPQMQTVEKTKRTLAVTLTGQTLKQYFDENLDTLLTPAQKSSYEWYLWVSSLWGSGDFINPIEDDNIANRVTQEFGVPGVLDGLPHRGIDFSYPVGTPIVNVISGTVVEVAHHYSWGLTVLVESEDGTYRVRYAHMSQILVGMGEYVGQGEEIGLVGNTGTGTGSHLHLEIQENGQLQNPRDYLPLDG